MSEKELLEIKDEDGVTIIAFHSSVISGVSGVEEVSRQIGSYIADNYPKKIVVDFTDVKFFSSQTLGLVLDIRRKLESYNGRVVISGINPQLYRVFKITNLDKIFSFYPDRQTAVESFESV